MTDGPDAPAPRQPGKRRHRRASSPATTGHPDAGHWTKATKPDGSRPSEAGGGEADSESDRPAKRRVAGADGGPESAQDRWWREQRPPHWD